MGRRAKSFTEADRQAAARQRRHAYLLTPRAIELQRSARHSRYWHLHGRQGSTPKKFISTDIHDSFHKRYATGLPKTLIMQAQQPLPESSHLFQLARESKANLDESDLNIWDRGPPYEILSDSSSENERRFTTHLTEVMHGRWARNFNNAEEISKDRLGRDLCRLTEYWEEQLQAALREWEQQEEILTLQAERGGHRELKVAKIWFQWVARHALHYRSLLN
ncbi:hypothetical protein JOM56_006452 [Amanita muscaria]